jgi:hypothetical protein
MLYASVSAPLMSLYTAAYLPQASLGNIQNTFREHSGHIQGIFSLDAVRQRLRPADVIVHRRVPATGKFREHSGHIQGTFRTHSGNIQDTFREHSGNVQDTFRERSGHIQGTFRTHSGNIQPQHCRPTPADIQNSVVKYGRTGAPREHSGNIQGTFIFREHSGNIQDTFREHSASTL